MDKDLEFKLKYGYNKVNYNTRKAEHIIKLYQRGKKYLCGNSKDCLYKTCSNFKFMEADRLQRYVEDYISPFCKEVNIRFTGNGWFFTMLALCFIKTGEVILLVFQSKQNIYIDLTNNYNI